MKPLSIPGSTTPTRALLRWHQVTAEMLHPAFEATIEEFAPIIQAFHDAVAEGHRFDAGVMNLMTLLELQAKDSDDDTDADVGVDDGQEHDPFEWRMPRGNTFRIAHVDNGSINFPGKAAV